MVLVYIRVSSTAMAWKHFCQRHCIIVVLILYYRKLGTRSNGLRRHAIGIFSAQSMMQQ